MTSARHWKRGDPLGSDHQPDGWEYAGYMKAWRDQGPAALVGVVVDTYKRPRPPVRPLLAKFGVFIRNLLDNFEA